MIHTTTVMPAELHEVHAYASGFLLPPVYTCRRRVSLESLKGTWVELGSALALMHIPREVRDRLMLLASDARSPTAVLG